MAEIAFGIIGVLGVALDVCIRTYAFISSISSAPRAIVTLAEHVYTLSLFLEPLLELLSKPTIRQRPQNIRFLPCVARALAGFSVTLNALEEEVKQYIRYRKASQSPCWAGWTSPRRYKYAFNKGLIVTLEAVLLGRMEALNLTMQPMDLSWTPDLAQEDLQTIEAIQTRANNLDSMSSRTTSLAVADSIPNRTNLDQTGASCGESRHPPNYNPDSRESDWDNGPDETEPDLDDEQSPWKIKVTVWSGDQSASLRGKMDSGADISLIHEKTVKKLRAPINRLTTPPIDVHSLGGKPGILGTVMLVLKVAGETKYTEVRAYVIAEWFETGAGLKEDILLGMNWIRKTETFLNAVREARRDPLKL